MKPYPGDWVMRSVLFVPGHNERMHEKAARTEADCFVLDLEDAVPENLKQTGREVVRELLKAGIYSNRPVFVRVNPLATGHADRDVTAAVDKSVCGFLYPEAQAADDIMTFEKLLTLQERDLNFDPGYFSLIAICETPIGVLNAQEIAFSSKRIIALIFGCEDFLAGQQGRHCQGDISLHTPRSMVAMAARAAGIESIDTPYVHVHDLEGLRDFAEMGRNLGMGGMCAVSPRQIEAIHEVYTPSTVEIEKARRIIDAAEEAEQQGVFLEDNLFVSPPTLKAARKLIARAQAIRSFEEFYGQHRN
jgi:citrate lyase subunit beta/citryl-CoA lyase